MKRNIYSFIFMFISLGTAHAEKFIHTGFMFDAVLETAIFSYNLKTPVVGFVDEDIFFLGQIIIPKKSRLIGEVQVVHTLDRVNIAFQTCVFPNGQEISVDFMALALDGSAGIQGKVEKHKDAVAARIAMKSVLSGVQAGADLAESSIEGAIATGLTTDALQMMDGKDIKTLESISVEERTPIKIFNKKRVGIR